MQKAFCFKGEKEYSFNIPDENDKVFETIRWGKFEEFFTPAYWLAQTWFFELNEDPSLNYKLGETFIEEVVACLLGGYGIPSEVGSAKFYQFKQSNILSRKNVSLYDIEQIMFLPIVIDGKERKYRFAKQKSKYIHDALNKLIYLDEEKYSDIELRNMLLNINGIGLKTASWIVRNYRSSDNIAILDIHLYRAGLLAGFYSKNDKVEKHYFEMERKFVTFCKNIGIETSKLDAVIWRTMKELNTYALSKI